MLFCYQQTLATLLPVTSFDEPIAFLSSPLSSIFE